MLKKRLRTIALAGTLTLAGALQIFPAAATVQSSTDTIRIDNGGVALPYEVATTWAPLILTQQDGSAWGFFTAQLELPVQGQITPALSTRKLFATHFDTSTGTWEPALVLPGEVAFAPTGVVDSSGTTHIVYCLRSSLENTSFATLIYMTVTAAGEWSQPQVVAASETAGHQLFPDLAIDQDGGLHLAWQDQRSASEDARTNDTFNADIFVSDLSPDGTWTEPVQLNQRPDDTTKANIPQLVADGDRLIAVWSVYTAEVGDGTAAMLMWSQRSIDDAASWSEPQPMFDRGTDSIGGKLLDVASDPNGGVTMVFGRRTQDDNQLFIQRMAADSDEWGEPALIASGASRSFPRIAISGDGTTYITYNVVAANGVIKVGAMAVAAGETTPGPEELLSDGEPGNQGFPSVGVDVLGRPWVMYFHQSAQSTVADETRVLRSAVISSQPVAAEGDQAPVSSSSPEASGTPEAAATPAG